MNGGDLGWAESGFDEVWYRLEPSLRSRAGAGQLVLQPPRERSRRVEGENGPAGRVGFEQVGEPRFDTRGFIAKGQRFDGCRESTGDALAVLLGLLLDADESGTFSLGLDRPDGLAIHKQQVVGFAMALAQRELTDGHTGPSVNVGVLPVLDDPAGLREQGVDVFASLVFWCPWH